MMRQVIPFLFMVLFFPIFVFAESNIQTEENTKAGISLPDITSDLNESTPSKEDLILQKDQALYKKESDIQTEDKKKITPTKKILLLEKDTFYKKMQSFSQDQQKLQLESTKRKLASYSSELVVNGNFELGHTGWNEYLKGYDGNYFNAPITISSGGGGYGSWYAYISESRFLESQPFMLPINTNYLDILYSAEFVHWGTCSYSTNGIGVMIWDETTNESVQSSLVHDANSDPYDYSYYTQHLATTASMQNRIGHKLSINYFGVKNDPNCTFALYLDNVSVVSSKNDTCIGNNCNVYRFWSDTKQGHFFTQSEDEANSIIANYPTNVWKYEGIAFAGYSDSSTTGSAPIYRFWSDQKQHHFYTASEDEKNYVIAHYPANIWRYEGIAYYAFPTEKPSSSPIYRFWSDQKQGHFYTSSAEEKNSIIANYPTNIWRYEGIAWYIPTN